MNTRAGLSHPGPAREHALRRGIRTKVVVLAVASTTVTGAAMLAVSTWQSDRFAAAAHSDVQDLVDGSIQQTAAGGQGVAHPAADP